ncbi:hypothetical protein SAMN04487906_0198 [Zhouia amylolytica]|uniref:Alpha-2-macroglobulin family N-terminal region n=1 Tax=Zhouia amylolytica TaxID=376730 RepID=A0A1I6PAK4_9FLAO|nr:MG2 domain-containing protein [Zhouia amylolytica]SFS37193.1 hypothetical protein SAMN04487906_0198 [Zhouia amylolytica]
MRLNYFYLLPLLALIIFSCKDQKDEIKEQVENLYKFREYISDVSPGMISTHDDFRIVLRNPVEGWTNDMPLDDNLIKITPNVKGKVVALNNQTVSFIPDAPLTQHTEYTIAFNLEDIIPDIPDEFEVFKFTTRTLKQEFNITTDHLQSYSKDWQYIKATLRSSDVLNLETARGLVTATQNKKQISIKFEEGVSKGTQFSFTIDSIQRFEDDSEVLVNWDGSSFQIDSKGETAINIPGKNNFSVVNVTVVDGDQQYLEINFSDPLKRNQPFDGLVVLEGAEKLKFSVEGNLLKAYPNKTLKGTLSLEIFQGIESTDGYKMKNTFDERIAFEQIKPQVRLLQSGTILPSSNNLKVNFEAVNLSAVDVSVIKVFENNVLQFLQYNDLNGGSDLRRVARPIARQTIELQSNLTENNGKWKAYAIDLKTLISPEPGAIYRVEFNFGKKYSTYRCEGEAGTNEAVPEEANYDEEADEESYWDNSESYYNDYYYGYNWSERENPCSPSYYYGKKISTNVLASDIGVTVKSGKNKSYFVSTTDLVTAKPIAGVKITFYNYQQQELGSVVSDEDGFNIYDSEHLAFFAIAEKNNQKTYVKLNDGNALSVSKFDVSGVTLQKGIKGYIYGERGVWRPGDTLFLSFMLNDKANPLPPNHPVKFELKDPFGKVTNRVVKTFGLNNLYYFPIKTADNAPTGNWTAQVTVGGARFSKAIKIETIKPNRLKIKTSFDSEILSSEGPIKANMEVAWLHGAIAKNLKTDVVSRYSQKSTAFNSFPNYVFDDPTRKFSSEELAVFEGTVDAEGKASYTVQPQLKHKAPGMLKASFITKVYENGGDFSTDVFSKTYSPYATYVGLSVPKGDKTRGMLLTDVKHRFDVATVDENGNPKSINGLKVTVYKVRWRWWWDSGEDNLSSYSGSQEHESIFTKTITTDKGGKASFDFELKYPEWGRYLVRVEDPKGGHATGQTVYIDWPGWAGKSRKTDPSAATVLAFSTDKDTYNVGEEAVVTFPSSEDGRALVTIENGTEVLKSMWINTQKEATKFELPISELYAPNVFMHISLIQPHATTENDLPLRLYGVVPIMVENPETILQPEISMPDVLRPEEEISIKVAEKTGKPMTYSIAIVDEGLLDLTRFKTPDPRNTFYAREALGVKTWDIYDDVIGAFGGRIDQVFSIGGDEDAAGARNKKANRFKPMVVYLGPFELKEGATQTHEVKIPKYIGSVRTMIVAGNPESEAYGQAEKTTPVRKPLMVLASLPRKITPGERVQLPVTVFAMENKVKDVTISLKKNNAFTIAGAPTQQLSFAEPDEKMVYFDLDISDFSGIGKVVIEARGNGERASYEVEIDVINPNPVTNSTEELTLDPNGSQTTNIETFGITGSNTAQIEFSTLPPMDFSGRMQYLIRYPHGCVEQSTSAAFPQLYLANIFDLTFDKKKQIQGNIEKAIKRLGDHQLPNGGFSYWYGQNHANDWGTSYAGHFLLEAEKQGYVLPISFKQNWISYQKQAAKQWRKSSTRSGLAQAYRLYTLALSGNADVSSMNRLRETSGISNETKHRLAAAYALIGQEQAAKEIFNTANISFEPQRSDRHTYGSPDRNRAMALETLILLDEKGKAQELAETIAKRLNENRWMSTQTTAYSLLGMAQFAAYIGGKGITASYTLNGKEESISSEKTLANRSLPVKKGSNSLVVKNNKEATLFVKVISSGILPVGEEKTEQRNLTVQVVFKGRDGSVLDINKLTQGTNFIAEVTVTNKKGEDIRDIALTEIFPSGWEIINTRFTDFGAFAANQVTHTDLRDDRALFYFDLKKHESKTVRVLLNASYLGKYYLPGIQCEAMYDNDYMVRTQGKWIEVTQ